MTPTLLQVDAFTATPFLGNPAAVCLTEGPVDEAWMAGLAREMNLSETAFLHPVGDQFALRWLTPVVEVDLCGHATLASAHALWEEGVLPPDRRAEFRTRSGLLTATRSADGWITLDFPAKPVLGPADPETARGVAALLGVPVVATLYNAFDLLAEVDSESTLLGLRPDLAALGRFPSRGLIVTARAQSPGLDFVSRFFAPAAGVDEDPVTGSAHACLGPYWSERLGKADLLARQVSARGGDLRVGVRGDRVLIAGRAVTVLRATLAPAALPPPLPSNR